MRRSICHLLLILICLIQVACGGGSSDNGVVAPSRVEYYVDASGGDDAKDGRSPESAWQTLAKVESAILSTGVTVFLKRNETWYESLDLPRNDLILDAYGQGQAPVLDGSVPVTITTNIGGGVYAYDASLAAGEGLGNVKDSTGMMRFVAWQSDVVTTLGAASTGSYTYDYATARLYIKPASLNNPYRLSKKLIAVRADNLSDINVRNIAIRGYSLHGIQFNNCTRCTAENISIQNIGGAVLGSNPLLPPDYIYAGNGIEFANSSVNGLVRNVVVSDIFDSCLTVQTFSSNQIAADVKFLNSSLARCGFAGVELSVLSNGGTTGSKIKNIELNDLLVSETGKGWSGRRYGSEGHGVRVKADKDAGLLTGVSMARLDVTGSAGDGIYLAGESGTVTVRQTAVYRNAGIGINFVDVDAISLKLDMATSLIYKNTGYGLSYNAPSASGLRLVHNTFVDNTTINLAVFSQLASADILNNVFYGITPMAHLFFSTTVPGAAIDHNCYNDGVNMFAYNGPAYSTVADFNSATSFDNNGVGNMPVLLANPAADDFSLSSASSCRALGVSGTGITTDYIGNAYGVPPDSGAYAYAN